MKNIFITAAALLAASSWLCPGVSQAAIWGRARLPAPWNTSAIVVDGRISDWPAGETYDAEGLRFRALNNGENLYLSVSAHEAGAKALLTGEIRQDVTLWFLDGKTRLWGLRLPFGALGVPAPGLPAGAVEPQFLKVDGTAVSTSSLPAEIEFGGETPGRIPIYELKVPLARLKAAGGGIGLDFVASYASADLEQRMKERFNKAAARAGGQADADGGMKPQGGMSGRGGGKMGGGKRGGAGGGRGGARQPPEFPSPLEVRLSVRPDADR
jgi:hypothetical protein